MWASILAFWMIVLMALCFLIGIGCILAGLMIYVFRKKNTKIWILGCIILICPVTMLIRIRINNRENVKTDETYVETGTMITWDTDDEFTYDEKIYVRAEIEDDAYWKYENMEMVPSFNIKRNDFLSFVFNFYEESVMYEIETGVDENIYYCENTGELYWPKESHDRLQAYYSGRETSEWFWTKHPDAKYISLNWEKEEILFWDVVKSNTGKGMYIDEDEGYSSSWVIRMSADKLVSEEIEILYIDDGWYWVSDDYIEDKENSDKYQVRVVKLLDSMSEKIDKAKENRGYD